MSDFSTTTEEITRAVADRYLTLGDYDKQRPVSKLHVKELSMEMEAGKFRPTGPIALAEVNGGYFVINGRHTLTAIKDTGIAQRLPVIRYRCQHKKEVGELYSTYDINRARNPYARLKALGVIDDFAVSVPQANGINAALKLILADFRAQALEKTIVIRRDAEVWAGAWRKYRKEIRRYLEAMQLAEDRYVRSAMLKSGVAAVALVTLEVQDNAMDFWGAVAADDGLKQDDPAHRLNKWLLSHRNWGGGRDRQMVTVDAVAACWNAFYEGRRLSLVRATGKSISIKGTRWE